MTAQGIGSGRYRLLGFLVVAGIAIGACAEPTVAEDTTTTPVEDTTTTPVEDTTPEATTTTAEVAELFSIRIAYPSPSGTFSHFLVAEEEGFLEKHGLDAELILTDGGTATVQTLLAGEVDAIHIAGPSIASARIEGAPVVWIQDTVPVFSFKIFAQKGITDPEELRGGTFGISRLGSSTDFAARTALEDWGIEPESDIRLVEIGSTQEIFNALQAGSVDAGIFSAPAATVAESEGYPVLLDLVEARIPYPSGGTATTEQFAQENPDVLRSLIAAIEEAIAFMKANPERAAEIFSEFAEISPEEAAEALIDPLRAFNEDTTPKPELWTELLSQLAIETPAAADLDVNDLIDPSFAP